MDVLVRMIRRVVGEDDQVCVLVRIRCVCWRG